MWWDCPHCLCHVTRRQVMVELLLAAGLSASARNSDGQTPGMLASLLNKPEVAQIFAQRISKTLLDGFAQRK